jgi:hypothetical protein
VKGTHSTVSACTLPPWLPSPSNIVDRMNETFGGQLRDELIKLKNGKFKLTRGRSLSTGSRAFKLSSHSGHEDFVPLPIISNGSKSNVIVEELRKASNFFFLERIHRDKT